MARDFDGTNQRLSSDTPALTAVPITMACWFNADDATKLQGLMCLSELGTSPATGDFFGLDLRGDVAGDPVRATSYSGSAGGNDYASTSSGYSTGTWQHAAAVFATTTSRAAYLNGGSKGTDTASNTPSAGALERTVIAARISTSSDYYHFNGRIAEAAIWNVALTDAEILLLSLGYSPMFVRPASLVAYWPLMGRTSPEQNMVGVNVLTLQNAPTVASHPRVLRTASPFIGFAHYSAPTPPSGRRRSWATIIGG